MKVTHSGMDFLIPVKEIIGVRATNNTKVDILLNTPLQTDAAAGAAEVAAIVLTASTASDAAKTKQQLNAFIAEVGNALETSWTNPIYDVTLPYAIDGVAYLHVDYSLGTI